MNRISPKISTLHRNNRGKISVSDAHSQATNKHCRLLGRAGGERHLLAQPWEPEVADGGPFTSPLTADPLSPSPGFLAALQDAIWYGQGQI